MKATRTDRSSSIVATEFVWDIPTATEVHGYIWPKLESELSRLKPEAMLDLGCGNGVLSGRASKMVPTVVGIDPSQSGIELARKHLPSVRFLCAPIGDALPEALQKAFDIVLCTEVIEHLFFPRELFVRATEALKPGGTLIVTTPYHGYLKNLALALRGKYDDHWHPLRDYGHIKFFSEKNLRDLFGEQGFRVNYFSRVGRIPPLARSMIMGGTLG